jgi:rare lipoprotein A (peptidoglycan hydrolase)
MPKSMLSRHRAALCLLFAGSLALIGAQQLLGTVADAQVTTEAVADAYDFQHVSLVQPATASQTMAGAVPSGQFEDVVKPTATPTKAPTTVPTAVPTPAPKTPALYESGIASTYGEGDGFEGNLTACGQIFHTSIVQIAHKSLPCGTLVRVEDADTGRTVEAEVTDRGPYVPGRIVDLSWGAFQQLDPSGPGLLNVNVYLLDQ